MRRKKRYRSRGVPAAVLLLILAVLAVAGFLLVRMLRSAGEEPAPPAQGGQSSQSQTVPAQGGQAAQPQDPAAGGQGQTGSPEEALYQLVYAQVDGQQQTVRFTEDSLTAEEIGQVLARIQNRPEFFWLEGYSMSALGSDYQVTFDWKYDDLTDRRARVEQAVEEALAAVPAGAGDYETALALHDWLCRHIVYQDSSDGSAQDLYGALVNGRCVCAGYSAAYEYLLRRAGIQAETVRGTADNGTGVQSHAWTKLVLDGEIYYTDVTWDDQEDHPDGRTYAWFAVTSARMAATHFADPGQGADMTASTAVDCNYHYRNGWVLETWDLDRLAGILAGQPGDSLTVLAADETVYRHLLDLMDDAAAAVGVLEQSGHPTDRYTYYTTNGALCLDLFPG